MHRLLGGAVLALTCVLGPLTLTAPASAAAGWDQVSAGGGFTCGILGGRLYCWGDDGSGNLGNGIDSNVNFPEQITILTDWTSVSAGGSHTCALRAGRLYCWGSDSASQLGNGPSSSSNVTVSAQITTATDWKSVSAGTASTCAIRSTGKLYCWGDDTYGQLGNGSITGPKDAPT